jgi:hypothetical protein
MVQRLLTLSTQARVAEGSVRRDCVAAMGRVWRQLALEAGQPDFAPATLAPLAANPVIVDGAGHLRRVAEVFIEDAPEIAARFSDLAPQLLTPDDAVAVLYTRLGVRALSDSAQEGVAAVAGARSDGSLQALLRRRRALIHRIVAAETQDAATGTAFLKTVKVMGADKIEVRWRLQVGDEAHLSAAQPAKAAIDWQKDVLYVCRADGQVPWAAVARTLAQGIRGSRASGALALAVRQVLVANSDKAARDLLDELGYPG